MAWGHTKVRLIRVRTKVLPTPLELQFPYYSNYPDDPSPSLDEWVKELKLLNIQMRHVSVTLYNVEGGGGVSGVISLYVFSAHLRYSHLCMFSFSPFEDFLSHSFIQKRKRLKWKSRIAVCVSLYIWKWDMRAWDIWQTQLSLLLERVVFVLITRHFEQTVSANISFNVWMSW